MRVSKNISRGKEIVDLNEIPRLALEKRSVVVGMNKYTHYVRPAAFMLMWPLNQILKIKLYYAVKNATADHQ
jgi:hypothetical protein